MEKYPFQTDKTYKISILYEEKLDECIASVLNISLKQASLFIVMFLRHPVAISDEYVNKFHEKFIQEGIKTRFVPKPLFEWWSENPLTHET